MTEKVYAAETVTGGFETNLTLEEAREQVSVWEEHGYVAHVSKMDDPSWEDYREYDEDAEYGGGFTPQDMLLSMSSREEATQFAKEMLEAIGHEIDHQDGGFMVYDPPEE